MHATRTARKALGVSAVVMASTLALGAAASGVAAPSAKPRTVAAGTPGTIVFECFQVDRGPDPNAVVLAQTQNFGNDTVIVRRAVRVCEPALKLRDNPDPAAGTIQILPNATLTLGSDAGAPTVSMDGAIAMLRESPTAPAGGKVLASSMQGGGMVADSFFDVFLELAAVGNWQLDSFFDITYRMSATGGTAGPQSSDVSLHLVSQGPGLYSGPLPTPVTIGGAKFTNATLTLNDPTATNGTAATRVMECFRTEKGADPNDPYLLTTNNFGRDPVLVRQASTLCEGRSRPKSRSSPAPPPRCRPRSSLGSASGSPAARTRTRRSASSPTTSVSRAHACSGPSSSARTPARCGPTPPAT